ncbi:hypothetical protein T484DRAFT_1805409 [Baffinella frigidus]|nr:hypothetical protein T484DRAFT_1805409 [Cryptophyta sp. CCMP2293]
MKRGATNSAYALEKAPVYLPHLPGALGKAPAYLSNTLDFSPDGHHALGKVPAYLSKALDFSPDGHHVLELGGHIGAFAVFAALRGAR